MVFGIRPAFFGARSDQNAATDATRAHLGYILAELLVALAVLSIGVLAVNRALRETVVTRGQARDFTHARFLLEQIVGNLELQPLLKEETRSGTFDGEFSRFSWTYTVSRVDVAAPVGQVSPTAEPPAAYPATQLGKIAATVQWTRAGTPFERRVETLVEAERLDASRP